MNYKPATFHSKLFVYRVIRELPPSTSWKPINPSAPDGVSGVHLAMATGYHRIPQDAARRQGQMVTFTVKIVKSVCDVM